MPVYRKIKRTPRKPSQMLMAIRITTAIIITLLVAIVLHHSENTRYETITTDYQILYPQDDCFQLTDCPLNRRIWSLLTHRYSENTSYVIITDYSELSGNEELVAHDGCFDLLAEIHEFSQYSDCLLDVYGNLIIVVDENAVDWNAPLLFAVDKPPYHLLYPSDDCSDDTCLIPASLHSHLSQLYGENAIFVIFPDEDCYPPLVFTVNMGEAIACIVDSDGDAIVIVTP